MQPIEKTILARSLKEPQLREICIAVTNNEVKGDDGHVCLQGDKVTLAVAIDGVSESKLTNDDSMRECPIRGSLATSAVKAYYRSSLYRLEEFAQYAGRGYLPELLWAAEGVISPGDVRIDAMMPTIKRNNKIIEILLNKLFNRKQCITGGQAVLSGIAAITNLGIIHFQLGDSTQHAMICHLPLENKNNINEAIRSSLLHNTYIPLPSHTYEGSPLRASKYIQKTSIYPRYKNEAHLQLKPTTSLIPSNSLEKYLHPRAKTLLVTVLATDGVLIEEPLLTYRRSPNGRGYILEATPLYTAITRKETWQKEYRPAIETAKNILEHLWLIRQEPPKLLDLLQTLACLTSQGLLAPENLASLLELVLTREELGLINRADDRTIVVSTIGISRGAEANGRGGK